MVGADEACAGEDCCRNDGSGAVAVQARLSRERGSTAGNLWNGGDTDGTCAEGPAGGAHVVMVVERVVEERVVGGTVGTGEFGGFAVLGLLGAVDIAGGVLAAGECWAVSRDGRALRPRRSRRRCAREVGGCTGGPELAAAGLGI